jgi:hypothetical protein
MYDTRKCVIFTDKIQHYKFIRKKSDILVTTFSFHKVFWLQCPSTAVSIRRRPVTTPRFLQQNVKQSEKKAFRLTRVFVKRSSDNRGSTVLIAFPRQQWLRERASILRLYLHCLSCFMKCPT